MKKLLLGLGITLAIVACQGSKNNGTSVADSSASSASDTSSSSTFAAQAVAASRVPTLVTLNGYPVGVADQMESAIFTNAGGYKAQTNTWYDAKFIHQVDSLLHDEGADGFRLYYARDTKGGKKHNVLWVSTRSLPKHLTDPDRDTIIHQDYFEHVAPFLSGVQGVIQWGNDRQAIDLGASAYDRTAVCPKGCAITNDHYITCAEARARIQKLEEDQNGSKINMSSEWFDIHLLDVLDDLVGHGTKLDVGVRLYFAKKYIKKDKMFKNSFVFTKTVKVNGINKDNNDCDYVKMKEDYDNGEQCPNNCYGVTWQPDSTLTKKARR